MSTVEISNFDKAAIVLCCLSPQQADQVLAMLGPEHGDELRQRMKFFKDTTNFTELKDQVLAEFGELQHAVNILYEEGAGYWIEEPKPKPQQEQSDDEPKDQLVVLSELIETEDPTEVVRELTVDQLVATLRGEQPRTIGIVLHHVTPETSADVLMRLPLETRRETFVEMSRGLPNNRDLISRILRAVVRNCITKEQSSTTGTKVFKTLAELLHAVDRDDREEMMDALQTHDTDAAAKVDDLLFNFEDIVDIEDRSLQRILAEIDVKVMAAALYSAPERLVEKVFRNRSAHVVAMIEEEMRFQGSLPMDRVQQARRRIVDVIRKHDRSDTLTWE